jgi:hypothetical protein
MYWLALGHALGLGQRPMGHLYIFLTNLEAQPPRIHLISSHLVSDGPNPFCIQLPAYRDLTLNILNVVKALM